MNWSQQNCNSLRKSIGLNPNCFVWVLRLATMLVAAPLHATSGQEGSEPAFSARVNSAIRWGVEYLQSQQREDGTFPGYEARHPGGMTACVALALVKSGVPREDPTLERAREAIRDVSWSSVYSAAMALMLFQAWGEDAEFKEASQQALKFLEGCSRNGLYGYPWDPIDLNNTQFAILGYRAAWQMNLVIQGAQLEETAAALFRHQTPAGGFAYHPSRPATAGMTVATLAGIEALAQMAVNVPKIKSVLKKHQRDLKAAVRWLPNPFDVTRNRYGESGGYLGTWYPEYLWSVERYGGLSGQSEIHGVDWYREGRTGIASTTKP